MPPNDNLHSGEVGGSTSQRPKRKFSNYPDPIHVVQTKCCMDECLQHLAPKEIELCQEKMKTFSETEQLQYIMHEIRVHTILRNRKTYTENVYNFIISGKKVCSEGWRIAFNISTSRFKSALKHVKDGYYTRKHGNKGRKRPTAKATNALGWMRHTFERIGKCRTLKN